MDYEDALKAAGANVLEYEQFGSYQGDWIAKVEYNNETGWITGSYGSCSGCDAFAGEFDFAYHNCTNGEDFYNPLYDGFTEGCPECENQKQKLINFGKNYLIDMQSFEETMKYAKSNIEWDIDAQEMVDWLEKHK